MTLGDLRKLDLPDDIEVYINNGHVIRVYPAQSKVIQTLNLNGRLYELRSDGSDIVDKSLIKKGLLLV